MTRPRIECNFVSLLLPPLLLTLLLTLLLLLLTLLPPPLLLLKGYGHENGSRARFEVLLVSPFVLRRVREWPSLLRPPGGLCDVIP